MILEQIKNPDFFNNSEQNMIYFLQNNLNSFDQVTLNKMAKESFSSTSSVLRFCKKLGFDGFKDFKLQLIREASISGQDLNFNLPFSPDDSVEDILNNFDSCDVEIELNQLTIESRALLQGSKVVDGMLIENKDDIAPDIALGFRSKKSNGKYRYVWLLKGKFEHTEDEYETIGEKATPKTNSLKGSFYSRNDGNWRIMEDEDSEGSKPERLKTWFDEVPEIPTETNPEG